jgi:hypothetical protein
MRAGCNYPEKLEESCCKIFFNCSMLEQLRSIILIIVFGYFEQRPIILTNQDSDIIY